MIGLALVAALAGAPASAAPACGEGPGESERPPVWQLGLPPAPERHRPDSSPPTLPALPDPEVYALSGGGVVHLVRRPELPLVRIEVSVSWPGSEAGLRTRLAATLAGDLLGGGTRALSAEAFASAAERLGAELELGVTSTRLWADLEVPLGAEEQAIELLAQAVREPRLRWGEARRAARRWADWRRDLWLDLRRSHARGENHAWFPEGHPSRHSASEHDLRRLRARHARRALGDILEGGQLYIAAVGAVDEDILPALERGFGDLRGRLRPTPVPAVTPQASTWLVERPGFDVAAITLMTPGPSLRDADQAATEVLMGLLAGDFTSRLETELRQTRGLTYGVDGSVQVWENSGRLVVSLEAQGDRTAEALAAIRAQLDQLLAEGVSEEEVARARRALILEAGGMTQTNAQLAATLGKLWLRGESVPDLQARLEAIEAVSPAAVERAAARWLAPAGRVWVVTGDPAVLEPALRDVGLPPDVSISARELSAQR